MTAQPTEREMERARALLNSFGLHPRTCGPTKAAAIRDRLAAALADAREAALREASTKGINARDDHIATLEAENARLREERDEYERERNQWRADCQQQLIYTTEALQRAETAGAQLAEARRALETKGLADAYRDGFDAALHTADSFKSVVVWGPSASPADAYNAGIQHLREVLHKARAALAPAEKPGSDGEHNGLLCPHCGLDDHAIGCPRRGRADAVVKINGVTLADELIRAGVGRPYDGGARAPWCE